MGTEQRTANRRRARVTNQGQITIPKALRDELGLRPGDDVEFVSRDGLVIVEARRRRSILEFAGIAASAAKRTPATAEEIDEMLATGMAAETVRRHDRVVRQATARGRTEADPGG